MGEANTDEQGHYAIEYPPGNAPIDLSIIAFDPKGNEIARSPLLLGAGPHEIVDLIHGNQPFRGPSEYAALRTVFDPLLDEVHPADFNDRDIAMLAAKTGVEPRVIVLLRECERLARKTKLSFRRPVLADTSARTGRASTQCPLWGRQSRIRSLPLRAARRLLRIYPLLALEVLAQYRSVRSRWRRHDGRW